MYATEDYITPMVRGHVQRGLDHYQRLFNRTRREEKVLGWAPRGIDGRLDPRHDRALIMASRIKKQAQEYQNQIGGITIY